MNDIYNLFHPKLELLIKIFFKEKNSSFLNSLSKNKMPKYITTENNTKKKRFISLKIAIKIPIQIAAKITFGPVLK